MPFEILNKEIEIAVDKIIAQVKRNKNGIVADSLKKAGIIYEMNYGVSIVHLRNIARTFAPNNDLSRALWRKKWRETMMLASFLMEKDSKSIELLTEFTEEAHTEEVLQQLGMNSLSCFPKANLMIKDFITSVDTNKRIVACYAISSLCISNKLENTTADDFTQRLLETPIADDGNWIEINALAKALSKVGFISKTDNQVMLDFFNQRSSLSKSWHIAYEMVKTEFEYR